MLREAVALRKESVDRNRSRSRRWRPSPPSLSARRAWIEINRRFLADVVSVSLSARRAWIEIWASGPRATGAGSLSARRAWIEIDPVTDKAWALEVALRKESVDRNCWRSHSRLPSIPSLSARRAWIEMVSPPAVGGFYKPALRSLSARRAWIEIEAPSSAP